MANARITKLSEDLSKFQKVAKESIASQTEHDATDFVFDQQFKNLSIESRRLESKLRESEVVNVQQKKALEDLIQKMRNELHVSQEDVRVLLLYFA